MPAACAQKQDQATAPIDSVATKSADSVSIGSTAPEPSTTIPWKQFVDNDLFTKLLPFDPADTAAIKEWFPNAQPDVCDVFENEDGTIWYKSCAYTSENFNVSYFDFFDNAPHRYYYNSIYSKDPNVVLSKGIHAGMSKDEFLSIVSIPGITPEDNHFWAFEEEEREGEHYILFEFVDNRLEALDFRFIYDSVPNVLVDFMNNWTEINMQVTEGEDEDVTEAHVPCGPRTYQLQEIDAFEGGKEVAKHLLMVGMVQDSRIDSVQSIKRTEDGFVITALNSYAAQSPYKVRIRFKDNTWNLAEWNGVLFAGDSYDGVLYRDECDGEEPL